MVFIKFMAKDYIQPTDEKIRTRAYYLWETDGKPAGRDWEYWLKAKEQLEHEITGTNGSSPRKASAGDTKKRASRSPVYA